MLVKQKKDGTQRALAKLFSTLNHVRVTQRDAQYMAFNAELNDTRYNWKVSFEAFDNIKQLLEHFEWALPVVVRTHNKVFYTPYFKYCLENNCACSTVFGSMYDGLLRDLNVDLPITCLSCELDKTPLCSTGRLVPADFIDDVIRKRETRRGIVIVSPKEWHQEHLDFDIICDHFEFHKRRGVQAANLFDTLCKRLPYINELRTARLPFDYIKPMVFTDLLCPPCLAFYKPVWSWANMKYYKEEVIELYLVLSKHGLPWDLVIQVVAFKVDLGIYEELKGWSIDTNIKQVSDEGSD